MWQRVSTTCDSGWVTFGFTAQLPCLQTPKALTNSSPGLELATTLDPNETRHFNAEGVGKMLF
jgi:hypothetical protein